MCQHGISIKKSKVFNICILSSLYCMWDLGYLPEKICKRLERFHQQCQRLQMYTSDVDILGCSLSINREYLVLHRRLRWGSHVARVKADRITKQILYGELPEEKKDQRTFRYRDIKTTWRSNWMRPTSC